MTVGCDVFQWNADRGELISHSACREIIQWERGSTGEDRSADSTDSRGRYWNEWRAISLSIDSGPSCAFTTDIAHMFLVLNIGVTIMYIQWMWCF